MLAYLNSLLLHFCRQWSARRSAAAVQRGSNLPGAAPLVVAGGQEHAKCVAVGLAPTLAHLLEQLQHDLNTIRSATCALKHPDDFRLGDAGCSAGPTGAANADVKHNDHITHSQ